MVEKILDPIILASVKVVLIMENQSAKGYIVSRIEIKELLLLKVGVRIRSLRLKLEGIYPGEFNLKKVAKELGLSENGLTKTEKGNTTVQDVTVELAENYFSKFNVPLGFFDKVPVKTMKPFYLGKQTDMLPYFDLSYETNGQKHFLDSRELPEIDNSYFRYCDPSIDTEQADVIQTDDGGFELTQVGIEVTLNVYQASTQTPLWEKRITQMAVISPSELLHFEKALRRDADVLIRQYSEMFSLQMQLKESQTREQKLKSQIDFLKRELENETRLDH